MVLALGLLEVPIKLPTGAAAIQSRHWDFGSDCKAHYLALKLVLARVAAGE